MPLIKSSSDEAFKKNVAEMVHSGHPQNQAVAAAYETKREAENKSRHEDRSKEREQHEKDKYGK